MAKLTKSADALISDVTDAVKSEMLETLQPILDRLSDAASELSSALKGGRPRRGRPPKKRRGRKASASRAAGRRGGAKKGAGRPRRRTPRGALQKSIGRVLKRASGAIKLSAIREQVLKTATFKGRNPKTLYTMIIVAIRKMPNVQRTPKGLYELK